MQSQEDYILVIAFIMLLGFIFIIAVWFNIVMPFLDMRQYIKAEIKRSLDEDEYRYWKSELRDLYIEHIPIAGRLMRRKKR